MKNSNSRTMVPAILTLCVSAFYSTFACADSGPDDHAPIGVMGDHTHHAGEVMLSYRYMAMTMKDNRDGTDRLPLSHVLRSGTGVYAVAPVEMEMAMHMIGIMYAPGDRVTLMAMFPFVENKMDHVTAMGGSFSTESSHLGDVGVSALVPFGESSLWKIGLTLPTGSQDETGLTPMGNVLLPYPMQIGSGTYDLTLGIGTRRDLTTGSLGMQSDLVLRMGENDAGYRLGNLFTATLWYAHEVSDLVSVSARGRYENRDNYHGSDSRFAGSLVMNTVPTVDPNLRGGERFDVALGANFLFASGHRIALEYQVPVYQNLDGPQLETDSVLTLGWQYKID